MAMVYKDREPRSQTIAERNNELNLQRSQNKVRLTEILLQGLISSCTVSLPIMFPCVKTVRCRFFVCKCSPVLRTTSHFFTGRGMILLEDVVYSF